MSTVGAAHNVQVLGCGQTTVVLGHGFGTDQSVWKYLVPHLVDQYRVIVYDNMGCGTTNPDYFDFDRYSTIVDLLAILEEFNAGECIYVGHSLSSMVAVYASILRPDLFHKLILMSASPRYLNTDDYNGGFDQKDLDQLWSAMESNFASVANGKPPLKIGGDMETMEMQEFARTLFNVRPDIAMSVVRTIFLFDMRPFLGSVTVPCHIIQSSKDWAVPLAVAEYLHHNIGGKSIVETMSAEGHLPDIPVLLRHIHHDIDDDASANEVLIRSLLTFWF